MWLKDGSYELVTNDVDCLNIIEEKLGYEMREFVENKFFFVDDVETIDDYYQERLERKDKYIDEVMREMKTFCRVIEKGESHD